MANIDRIKIRHQRIRKRLLGTSQRPRLSVHFSGQHIYAQIIDDVAGKTVAAASTVEGEVRGERRGHANVAMAVFDRGGFTYHGKVKALADAARSAGLKF